MVLFDASGQAIAETSEQWRASALLGWLTDSRVARVVLRKGTPQVVLHNWVKRLRLMMVEWEHGPAGEFKPKLSSDGNPIERRMTAAEIVDVKRNMLLLLRNRAARQAIALHDARSLHAALAKKYMDDDTDTIAPPAPMKKLVPQVREQLQSWREDLESWAKRESGPIVRPW